MDTCLHICCRKDFSFRFLFRQGISALDFDRKEDEAKHVVHLSLPQQLVFVRWNLANQDEQKIVIKVQLTSENCRTKALKIAAEAKGVSNVSIVVEKAEVEVIGVGVDAVSLAKSLEKQLGFASIVSVGEVKEPEEPELVIPIQWTLSYIHCHTMMDSADVKLSTFN
ncbi:unnamed protein product [Prunus armeniaca]|uniref:HMA domain-containing protein n=1 Tax=Prunus armeniaca TaxID=36596 RepID=A0A6J5XEF0_PRUAR|nr:unnamed protein product [Prunus armeniaca]